MNAQKLGKPRRNTYRWRPELETHWRLVSHVEDSVPRGGQYADTSRYSTAKEMFALPVTDSYGQLLPLLLSRGVILA